MKKHSWRIVLLVFVLIALFLFWREFIPDKNNNTFVSDDVIYKVGEIQLKIPKEYLYSLLLKSKGRKIKDEIEASYVAFDVLYPDMLPVRDEEFVPGRGSKISVYLRNRQIHNTKNLILNWTDGRAYPIEGMDKENLRFYKQRSRSGEESSGDRDIYIYKDHEIYMSCPREGGTYSSPYPSCNVVSHYKGMEMSASFSADYKHGFVRINDLIFQLLRSFEERK